MPGFKKNTGLSMYKWATSLIICWVVILSLMYSFLSVIRHDHFQSGGFDLGIFDQAVWQYSRFQYPYNTVKERFILGDHLTLNLPLLAPLYWIWDDVRVLLIFQAVWISFSTFAVYKLVLNRKFSPVIALSVSILYSLFYGIQYGVFFDFHPVVIGVGLMAWLVYFFETGKRKLFFLTLILLLSTQENMGLALAGLGMIYLFRKDTWKIGAMWVIGGIAASLLSARIVSLFSPVGFQYAPEFSLNPVEIVRRYFDSPEKREVWKYTYSWFSFIPLFSPGSVLAVLFDLAQYFVTGDKFQPMWSIYKHHRAILSLYLVLGVLDVFDWLRTKKIRTEALAVGMVVVAVFLDFSQHLPLNKLSKAEYWKEETWMADDRILIRSIDAGASVATQQNFVPHLTHRNEIYIAWPRQHEFNPSICGEKLCWWLDFAGRPEYLVVDTRPDQWLTQTLESSENFLSAVENMETAGTIEPVRSVGKARLYRIKN